MSNYPEGVTGNEWQIAGASGHGSDTQEVQCGNEGCDAFERLEEVEGKTTLWEDEGLFEWVCLTCGTPASSDYTPQRQPTPPPERQVFLGWEKMGGIGNSIPHSLYNNKPL